MNNESLYQKCVGAKVVGVDAGDLRFADGRVLSLNLDADCCSRSTWTDPRQFEELVGATIQRIEERNEYSGSGVPDPEGADCLSWHFLVFVTDKGHVTIDWHNDSNGYYDGWVVANLREVSP